MNTHRFTKASAKAPAGYRVGASKRSAASIILASSLLVFLATTLHDLASNDISHLRAQRRSLLSESNPLLQACPSTLNRPAPQLPARPDLLMSPTYAASIPGLGDELLTHYLIENITGIHVGEATTSPSLERMRAQGMDQTGFARGQTEVVALHTSYPHTDEEFSSWDVFLRKAFVILRNPLSAIPSYFDHLYEQNNHLPSGSSNDSSEENAAWIKWRDNQFADQLILYRRFVNTWMKKYDLEDETRSLFVAYEDLVDEYKGPQMALRLTNFLVQGVKENAMEMRAKSSDSIVNSAEVSSEAVKTFADVNDIPCVWKHTVYDSMVSDADGTTRGEWSPTERPFTPEQLAAVSNILSELINTWNRHDHVVSILTRYHEEVTNFIRTGILQSDSFANQQASGTSSASVTSAPNEALASTTTDGNSLSYEDNMAVDAGVKAEEDRGLNPTAGQTAEAYNKQPEDLNVSSGQGSSFQSNGIESGIPSGSYTEQQAGGASSSSAATIDTTTDGNIDANYIKATSDSGIAVSTSKEGDAPIPTTGQIVDTPYTGQFQQSGSFTDQQAYGSSSAFDGSTMPFQSDRVESGIQQSGSFADQEAGSASSTSAALVQHELVTDRYLSRADSNSGYEDYRKLHTQATNERQLNDIESSIQQIGSMIDQQAANIQSSNQQSGPFTNRQAVALDPAESLEEVPTDGKRISYAHPDQLAPKQSASFTTQGADSDFVYVTLAQNEPYADYITTESGMKYLITREGDGPIPATGQIINAHYTGWLDDFESPNKFDSSRDRGQPFKFTVGLGQVLRGWDESFLSMKPGERRNIILPSALAYGEQGAGVIPPGATLYFEVELLADSWAASSVVGLYQ